MPSIFQKLQNTSTKAFLFDLDETLVDREASLENFVRNQYAQLDLSFPSYEVYLARFRQLDERGYADRMKVFQTLVTEFSLPISAVAMMNDFGQNAWQNCKTFPDTYDVLITLPSYGYKLGIVTNGSSESQRAKLVGANLTSLVDVALISEEEEVKKPDQEIFVRAARKLDVGVEDCVFVGDNPKVDIYGAYLAGMQTIWFKGFLAWPDDLEIISGYTIEALKQLFDPMC